MDKYEQALEQWLMSIIADGDDDALFASGYLQGHFAVVLSELEGEGNASFDTLNTKMQACLLQATRELEDPDYQLVVHAWHELKKRLSKL